MNENTEINNKIEATPTDDISKKDVVKKSIKPPKLEDKPFNEFINDHLIPTLTQSLTKHSLIIDNIQLYEGFRPVSGDKCWNLSVSINNGRKFWLSFTSAKLTSSKTIAIAETGTDPTLLESFLIDEKKVTLQLIVSRILQRLNGQKWLGEN